MINRILIAGGLADSLLNFRGRLIEQLHKSGIEVHVAASSNGECAETCAGLKAIGATFHGIPMTRTGKNPRTDLKTLKYFYCLMRQIRPDAILSYTAKAVIYGSIAARLAGVPKKYALISGLGYAFQGGGNRNCTEFLVRQLYRVSLSGVDKVFFQNPDDCELFRSRRILSSKIPSCVVHGSGVDVNHFAPVSFPSDATRFLMTCRFLGAKGVREYVQAARIVKAKYPKSRFALVGWIDSHPDMIRQEELDEWIASGTIEYLGRLADVRPALANSSVFVLPSYYREGTPRSILEALSMGRPVITTDAPGCRETVEDGVNGLLVPPRNSEAIVQSMLRFIESPVRISQMGMKSREIAVDKYDVRKVNQKMIEEMNIL